MNKKTRTICLGLLLWGAVLPFGAGAADLVFDSSMPPPVDSVPLKPTRFTLTESRYIERIQTWHWNRGAGAAPGSIALQGPDRKLIGPWKAMGIADETGVADAYWEVAPDLQLEAGSYTVLDSDPATWSRNPEQGNVGIVRVYAAAGKDADADTQPVEIDAPLSLEAQQQLATELFEQLRNSDRYDYEKIESLYLRVINECPDVEQAEESYFRLSNLYRMGFDPPEYGKLRLLLESFLERYPDSPGRDEMHERLLRAYENIGAWEKAVAIYDQSVPKLADDYPYLLVTLLDYARALEGAGERERALEVYREVVSIAGGPRAGAFDMSDLWLRAAGGRVKMIERILARQWQEVVAGYQRQFGDQAWAEMPQVQELLEYAQALEAVGDTADATRQYRKVLRTDQGYRTRQAQLAAERLQALGAEE